MRASLLIVAALAAPAVAKDPSRLVARQESGEGSSVSVAGEESASAASTDASPSTTTTDTASSAETTQTSRTRTSATSTLWTSEAETTADARTSEAESTTEAWTSEAEITTKAATTEAPTTTLPTTTRASTTRVSTTWPTTTATQATVLPTSSQYAPSRSTTLLNPSTSALPPPPPIPTSYDPSANLRQTATIPTDLTTEAQVTTSYVDITATVEPTGYVGASQVYFPGSNTYWTYGAVSFVQWSPALPDSIDIQLINDDLSLLAYPYTLSAGVGPGTTEMAVTAPRPVEPGPGYYVVLADSANGTLLSVSSEFEIKPKGTSPIYPAAYGAQISALVPSDAGRRVSAWRAWAAAAGALIGAVVVLAG